MISVIIPTYKRAKYIERAVNSVLGQTYKDFEIIIVDDNNPNTKDRKELEGIISKYKENKKIVYIQHEKNKNGAAARNTGINRAKGEYITFLDDDDYYMPDRLEKLKKILDENKEYNAAYTGVIIVKNKKIIKAKRALHIENPRLDLLEQKSFFGTGSNMFFRAEAIKNINGFDENFKRNQDLEVMIRFLRKNKIMPLDELLVVKNQDDRNNEPSIQNMIELKEFFLKNFDKDIQEMGENAKDIYFSSYYSVLSYALIKKEYSSIKFIKQKFSKNVKLDFKSKLKLIFYFISPYLPVIFKIINYLKNARGCKIVNKNLGEYINKMENSY